MPECVLWREVDNDPHRVIDVDEVLDAGLDVFPQDVGVPDGINKGPFVPLHRRSDQEDVVGAVMQYLPGHLRSHFGYQFLHVTPSGCRGLAC